jgi:hypothetical protein
VIAQTYTLQIRKAMFSTGSFKFPKHNELFTEDYYDEGKDQSNPFDKEFSGGPDFLNQDKPTHRSTHTGILSNYKK